MRLTGIAPSVLAALGAGEENPLGFPRSRRVCVLLVDGLGDNLLDEYAEHAPTLTELRSGRLRVGFPSSTPTSLATLSTGLEPGQHGFVGVTTVVDDVPLHLLKWEGPGSPPDPRHVQSHSTLLERVRGAGLSATQVALDLFEGTGFTEAVFRGGEFRGMTIDDDVARFTVEALAEPGYVYAYTPRLDRAGHVHGPGSEAWLSELRAADATVARLVAALPPNTFLAVTGDHGMLTVPPENRFDLDARPELLAGVRHLAGEPRAITLHCAPGQQAAVEARWREAMVGIATVTTRADALRDSVFGPVSPANADRIADLIITPGPDGRSSRPRPTRGWRHWSASTAARPTPRSAYPSSPISAEAIAAPRPALSVSARDDEELAVAVADRFALPAAIDRDHLEPRPFEGCAQGG